MLSESTKFDPEEHKGNAYEAFLEFIESYHYEYDAISKEPPKSLETAQARASWIEQNKRKIFLGKFASRNLQREYEEITNEQERTSMSFADMVKKIREHLKAGSNTTLANFQFNSLTQKEDESFDAFSIRIKNEARRCDFTCESETCSVKDTLARDRIIIGTNSDDIRQHALKNQWNLMDLIANGRRLEAASIGAKQIKAKDNLTEVRRVRQPGKYSKKTQAWSGRKNCDTCSSKACRGGDKCPGAKAECYSCGKLGHFRGAKVCKGKGNKEKTRRVESDQEESDSKESNESGTTEEEETKSKIYRTRASKHITKVRRMRISRNIHRKRLQDARKHRYEVQVIIKEHPVQAFADTGADICIMSKSQAKERLASNV